MEVENELFVLKQKKNPLLEEPQKSIERRKGMINWDIKRYQEYNTYEKCDPKEFKIEKFKFPHDLEFLRAIQYQLVEKNRNRQQLIQELEKNKEKTSLTLDQLVVSNTGKLHHINCGHAGKYRRDALLSDSERPVCFHCHDKVQNVLRGIPKNNTKKFENPLKEMRKIQNITFKKEEEKDSQNYQSQNVKEDTEKDQFLWTPDNEPIDKKLMELLKRDFRVLNNDTPPKKARFDIKILDIKENEVLLQLCFTSDAFNQPPLTPGGIARILYETLCIFPGKDLNESQNQFMNIFESNIQNGYFLTKAHILDVRTKVLIKRENPTHNRFIISERDMRKMYPNVPLGIRSNLRASDANITHLNIDVNPSYLSEDCNEYLMIIKVNNKQTISHFHIGDLYSSLTAADEFEMGCFADLLNRDLLNSNMMNQKTRNLYFSFK